MRRQLAVVAVLAVLAGCQRSPAPGNEAMPSPTPSADLSDSARVPARDSEAGTAALPTPELDGVATAPGAWRFQVSGDGDQAVFGDSGEPSEFAMRCDPQTRRMVFSRADASGETMQIVAQNGAATFYTRPGARGRIEASDPATDTFLTDVLATAEGRIGVRVGDGATFAMPVDPVIRQTILRCAAPEG